MTTPKLEYPKPCECCGGDNHDGCAYLVWVPNAEQASLCATCRSTPQSEVETRIRARRQLTATTAEPVSSGPIGTGNAQSLGSGETSAPSSPPTDSSSVAPAVPDTGLLRDKSTCSSCNVPAGLNDEGACAYCVQSYFESREQHELECSARSVGNQKAAERIAAIERAERPRGNPAQRKQMEMGHPSGWPSIGDDEP